jgi:hypothetical protein
MSRNPGAKYANPPGAVRQVTGRGVLTWHGKSPRCWGAPSRWRPIRLSRTRHHTAAGRARVSSSSGPSTQPVDTMSSRSPGGGTASRVSSSSWVPAAWIGPPGAAGRIRAAQPAPPVPKKDPAARARRGRCLDQADHSMVVGCGLVGEDDARRLGGGAALQRASVSNTTAWVTSARSMREWRSAARRRHRPAPGSLADGTSGGGRAVSWSLPAWFESQVWVQATRGREAIN